MLVCVVLVVFVVSVVTVVLAVFDVLLVARPVSMQDPDATAHQLEWRVFSWGLGFLGFRALVYRVLWFPGFRVSRVLGPQGSYNLGFSFFFFFFFRPDGLMRAPLTFRCLLSQASPNIPAERLYDKHDDGLNPANSWAGCFVVLNPAFQAQVRPATSTTVPIVYITIALPRQSGSTADTHERAAQTSIPYGRR